LSFASKTKKENENVKNANKSFDEAKNKTTFDILSKIQDYHPKISKKEKSPYLQEVKKQDKELSYLVFKKEEIKKTEKKRKETSKKFLNYLKKILNEKTQHLSQVIKKF